MWVIFNIAVCMLTVVAFIVVAHFSIFNQISLRDELNGIRALYVYRGSLNHGEKFTLFLAKREVERWLLIVENLGSYSTALSLFTCVIQWGLETRKDADTWDYLKSFLENPGLLFYIQFGFIGYIAVQIIAIHRAVVQFARL